MSCNTVASYTNGGCDQTGGVAEWYVFPYLGANGLPAITFTRDQTSNVITGVTVNDTTNLKTWVVEAETSTFTDTKVVSKTDRSKYYEQSATIVFHGTSAVLVEELNKMNGRYILIAKDNEGRNHVLGMKYGLQVADVFTPGMALGDRYAHELTLNGNETRKASILEDDELDTILNPSPGP